MGPSFAPCVDQTAPQHEVQVLYVPVSLRHHDGGILNDFCGFFRDFFYRESAEVMLYIFGITLWVSFTE